MSGKAIVLASFALCCCTLMAAALSSLDELSYSHAQVVSDASTVDELTANLEYLEKTKSGQYFFYSQIRELEGDLLMRISMLSSNVDEDLLGRAVSAFRSSIKDSPANGALWAKFATSKALLKQFDPEFDHALQKTFEYSGWEAVSTETIIRIGLTNTQVLGVESLLIAKESLRRLYAVNPGHTIDLARKLKQMHLACIWVRDMTPVNPWCQRELQ